MGHPPEEYHTVYSHAIVIARGTQASVIARRTQTDHTEPPGAIVD